MTNKPHTRPNQSLPDSERVTDPARVVWLLEQLAKQHVLLTAMISTHSERYITSIVSVDGPHVLLDELMPATGHKLLLSERTLQVTGKLDGIDISFSTTLEQVDTGDDMVTYHMSLPGRLEYRQRRMNYRASIPLARPLRVVLDDNGTEVEGELHDLSHGGAGMIFPAGPPTVGPGLLHECAIQLPCESWLFCAVELCYTKTIQLRDRQLIGARFADLTPVQARLVSHCIIELEREFIRKHIAE